MAHVMVPASRRAVLAGMLALPLCGASAPGFAARMIDPRARYLGAAVTPDLLRDPAFAARLTADGVSVLTPEYHGKWNWLERRPGQHRFAEWDRIADFARSGGYRLRGHTLIWHRAVPGWASDPIAQGDWSVIERHVTAAAARDADLIDEWDVINEPIDAEAANGLRRTPFLAGYGGDYIERVLHLARAAAPQAKLLINDFGLEYDHPYDAGRRRALLRLLEHLKSRGAPIDGIGLQGHLELGKGRLGGRGLMRFLSEVEAMGLTVTITELDVRESNRRLPVPERDARAADAVRALLDVAAASPSLRGVVTWGLSDRASWLQHEDPATQAAAARTPLDPAALNRGLPYDAHFVAKPMREVLRNVFA